MFDLGYSIAGSLKQCKSIKYNSTQENDPFKRDLKLTHILNQIELHLLEQKIITKKL